ncbi:MAG: hypothetical protein F6K19_19720 [Cyanothece sp. SIO1E1]|nr:hypothetical protein [Cyanothece sp. SIO1E1]
MRAGGSNAIQANERLETVETSHATSQAGEQENAPNCVSEQILGTASVTENGNSLVQRGATQDVTATPEAAETKTCKSVSHKLDPAFQTKLEQIHQQAVSAEAKAI